MSQESNVKSRTPVLDNFSIDLTREAEEGRFKEIFTGRDKEITQIVNSFNLKKKRNILIIEEPGMEGESIIKSIALKIDQRKIIRSALNKRIISLRINQIIAYKNPIEALQAIVNEVEKNERDIPFLYLGDLDTIITENKHGLDFIRMLIDSDQIMVIAILERHKLTRLVSQNEWLNHKFTHIALNEFTIEETSSYLLSNIPFYEERHCVKVSEGAIDAILKLSAHYNPYIHEPSRSKMLLDEVCSYMFNANIITPRHIEDLEKKVSDTKDLKNQAVKNMQYEDAANLRDQESKYIRQLEFAKIEWEEELKSQRYPVEYDDVLHIVSTFKGNTIEQLKNLIDPQNQDFFSSTEKTSSFNLNGIPDSIKTSLQQYILYFKDYLEKVKGENIYFEVHKTIDGLRFEIKPEEIDDMESLNQWFTEYMDYLRLKSVDFTVNFERPIEDSEAKIVMAELKNQIRFMESQMELNQLKSSLLEQENTFLKALTMKSVEKDGSIFSGSETSTDNTKLKNKFINLLSDGRTKEVLKEISLLVDQSSHYYQEILLLNSKLSFVERESNTGQISKREARMEIQSVTKSVLDLIKDIL